MRRKTRLIVLTAVLAAGAGGPAHAEGDPAKGKQVFNQCRACHSLKAGQHRVGPSLAGVWGRESGTADGFDRYSDAMKQADITWDAETLDAYLADPRGYIPGNNMVFPGVKSAGKRADVIAYLKQETQ